MKTNKAFVFTSNQNAAGLCYAANALADSSTAAVLGSKQQAEAILPFAEKVIWMGEKAEGAMVESYAGAIADLIISEGASLVLLGNGVRDRCIAAKLAVSLNARVITDATDIAVSEDGIYAKRNVFGGAAIATVKSTSALTILVMGSSSYKKILPSSTSELTEVIVKPDNCSIALISSATKEEESVDLAVAKRVVGIGRGLGSANNLSTVQAFTSKLCAELGCTRPIAEEEKLLAKSRYIGVSGATIVPDVYVACGISGQVQHTVGVAGAKLIIAINKDAKAPIMQNCDYGIVGDMNKIIPQLIELL